ncbi:MAG: general secretion pathway protein I [Thalassolituus sp.]|jgi:general secretion pathway protein I
MRKSLNSHALGRLKHSLGFTLLEVMIAVAIFAGVAVTITDTASMRVDNLLSVRMMTMASFVAENRLAEIQLTGTPPGEGENKDVIEMGDNEWNILTKVEKTQFPGMVRIDLSVAPEEFKDNYVITLSTVMGPH